jgi:DNA repair exonuclease SbcCD ATPase subunit
MSNNLPRKLRELNALLSCDQSECNRVMDKAADRIEQLEAENATLKSEVGVLEQQCKVQADSSHHWHGESQVLRQQLAASQARELQLREVLEIISIAPLVSDHGLPKYGISVSEMKIVQKILSIPSDATAALEALITKAGDVMKERAIYFGLAGNTIRAIPAVKLDDLNLS